MGYATIWIKGVLCNSKLLDDVVMVPSRDRALWNKVQGAWKDMVLEKGHTLSNGKARPAVSSAKDIAERLGMKRSLVENNIRRMACVTNVLSLDYQYTTTTRSGYAAGKRGALRTLRNLRLMPTSLNVRSSRPMSSPHLCARYLRRIDPHEITVRTRGRDRIYCERV